MKLPIFVIALSLLPAITAARAEERPKSMLVASILAADPIPGDALWYGERPVQAVIDGTVGLAAAGFFWVYLVRWLNGNFDRQTCTVADIACLLDNDGKTNSRKILFATSAWYGASLLWDAIGGLYYTSQINRSSQARYRLNIGPAIARLDINF